ncbi:hypothetical protein JCM10212_000635 [Sporobolomyces blumeae]
MKQVHPEVVISSLSLSQIPGLACVPEQDQEVPPDDGQPLHSSKSSRRNPAGGSTAASSKTAKKPKKKDRIRYRRITHVEPGALQQLHSSTLSSPPLDPPTNQAGADLNPGRSDSRDGASQVWSSPSTTTWAPSLSRLDFAERASNSLPTPPSPMEPQPLLPFGVGSSTDRLPAPLPSPMSPLLELTRIDPFDYALAAQPPPWSAECFDPYPADLTFPQDPLVGVPGTVGAGIPPSLICSTRSPLPHFVQCPSPPPRPPDSFLDSQADSGVPACPFSTSSLFDVHSRPFLFDSSLSFDSSRSPPPLAPPQSFAPSPATYEALFPVSSLRLEPRSVGAPRSTLDEGTVDDGPRSGDEVESGSSSRGQGDGAARS